MVNAEIIKAEPAREPVQTGDGATVLNIIEKIMASPNVDVERVERMMDLYKRTQDESAKKDFAVALNDCQSKMSTISKDGNNKQTRSKYATYAKLDAALRPIYSGAGFNVSFNSRKSETPNYVVIVAYLTHNSGHEREYELEMPADGKGAKGGDVMTKTHATGSAVKYGRRYLLEMIFNIATTDNDGNAAGPQERVSITSDQLNILHGLIEETETDIVKFLAFANVDCMSELSSKEFEQARAMLLKKKRGMNK